MMPREWKIEKLSRLTSKIGSGKTPLGGSKVYQDHGVLFLRSQNIYPNRFLLTDTTYIDDETHQKMKSSKVFPGDVLFNITGASIGRCAVFPESFKEANVNQHVCIIRPKVDLNEMFAAYFLNSWEGQRQLYSYLTVGNREGINFKQIGSFDIPLPPIKEQEKIAKILSTWDEAIEKLEQLIEAKKKRKKGLMHQLLTGKKRLPGFNAELNKIRFKEFCNIRRGASPRPIKDPKWFSESGRGWIRISDVTSESSRYLQKTTQYLSDLGSSKSVMVNPGDLIMSICATIGVPKILGIEACIHDGFVLFRDFEGKFDKYFLFHYLGMITDKLSSSGQPGTQKNLNTEIVGNIEIPKFDLEEQKRMSAVLNCSEQEILSLEEKLMHVKKQKKGLMQQLLTGKKRVI